MNPIAMLPTIIREKASRRAAPRFPEPEVMVGQDQVRAYSAAASNDPIMAASYAYQAASITRTIAGAQNVLDLGCGPATQLIRTAALNPDMKFTGLDLSPTMLDIGRENISIAGLSNISLMKQDITTLADVPDASFDAVTSSVAFHQLPNLDDVRQSFIAVSRVLKPGGAIHFVDFGRLKTVRAMLDFSYRFGWDTRLLKDGQLPHYKIFKDDYFNSLLAAFSASELADLAARHLPDGVRFQTSAPLPMICMASTGRRAAAPHMTRSIKALYQGLHPYIARELDGMRRFLKMGGISDPFL